MLLEKLSILCQKILVTGLPVSMVHGQKEIFESLVEEQYIEIREVGKTEMYFITPTGVSYLYDAVEESGLTPGEKERISRIDLSSIKEKFVLRDKTDPCLVCKEKCVYNSDSNFLKEEHLERMSTLNDEDEMQEYLNSLGNGIYSVDMCLDIKKWRTHYVTRLTKKAEDYSGYPNLIEEKKCPHEAELKGKL